MNTVRIFLTIAVIAFITVTARGDESLRHPRAAGASSNNSPAGARNNIPQPPTLPPLPLGVTELKFADFYKQPIGPLGLEYSDKLKSLEGRKVRILGYMVRQSAPVPWTFLFSPIPATLHEREYGFSEDLPATILHVKMQRNPLPVIPYTPGPLLLTGLLSVGTLEEADGRISSVRLILDPPNREHQALMAEMKTGTKTNSTITAPTSKPVP